MSDTLQLSQWPTVLSMLQSLTIMTCYTPQKHEPVESCRVYNQCYYVWLIYLILYLIYFLTFLNLDNNNQQNNQNEAPGNNVPNRNVQEAGPNQDWLDWLYVSSRVFIFISVLYFYSSPGRFIVVAGFALLLYL